MAKKKMKKKTVEVELEHPAGGTKEKFSFDVWQEQKPKTRTVVFTVTEQEPRTVTVEFEVTNESRAARKKRRAK